MMVITLQFVLYWLVATRAATGCLARLFGPFCGQDPSSVAAYDARSVTLAFVLFVQLADEFRRPPHQVLVDPRDDLTETFAASWATLDKTNSQMTFPMTLNKHFAVQSPTNSFCFSPHFMRLNMPPKKKSSTTPQSSSTESLSHCLFVGIDWADAEHAYAMRDPNGKLHQGTFAQKPEAIAELLASWDKLYPGVSIVICIETKRGALINALLEYKHLQINCVNPNQLANYRKSFAHGGGKSDPVDAVLIMQFLENYRDRLRPLQHDSAITRELALLAQHRRELVNQRVKLSQQLIDILKCCMRLFCLPLWISKCQPQFKFSWFFCGVNLHTGPPAAKQPVSRVDWSVGSLRRASCASNWII